MRLLTWRRIDDLGAETGSPPLAKFNNERDNPGTGVLSDQTIELTSARSRKAYAAPLRRVAYQDPVTKNRYVFVTNNTTWVAQTIADIYKSRWQIELFLSLFTG